ncbi:hypothetical protein [Endozoicomonas sp. ALB032]
MVFAQWSFATPAKFISMKKTISVSVARDLLEKLRPAAGHPVSARHSG